MLRNTWTGRCLVYTSLFTRFKQYKGFTFPEHAPGEPKMEPKIDEELLSCDPEPLAATSTELSGIRPFIQAATLTKLSGIRPFIQSAVTIPNKQDPANTAYKLGYTSIRNELYWSELDINGKTWSVLCTATSNVPSFSLVFPFRTNKFSKYLIRGSIVTDNKSRKDSSLKVTY